MPNEGKIWIFPCKTKEGSKDLGLEGNQKESVFKDIKISLICNLESSQEDIRDSGGTNYGSQEEGDKMGFFDITRIEEYRSIDHLHLYPNQKWYCGKRGVQKQPE